MKTGMRLKFEKRSISKKKKRQNHKINPKIFSYVLVQVSACITDGASLGSDVGVLLGSPVGSMVGDPVGAGVSTHETPLKHCVPGQTQTGTSSVFRPQSLHVSAKHVFGKSPTPSQHSAVLMFPPVSVQRNSSKVLRRVNPDFFCR